MLKEYSSSGSTGTNTTGKSLNHVSYNTSRIKTVQTSTIRERISGKGKKKEELYRVILVNDPSL